jgi:hypothetical protein
MELFYIIVTVIAIVFLILILTVIGILMRYQNKSTVFPPVANDCPDFWTIALDGTKCKIPGDTQKNVGSLYDGTTLKIKTVTNDSAGSYSFPTYIPSPATNGTTDPLTGNQITAPNTINFKDSFWSSQGKTAVCAQKQWADSWGITWDGITNYNSC